MSDDEAGGKMGTKTRVLHFIESGGIYGAESVIINLSREMVAAGRYEPIIGCIVQRDDEQVDLLDAASSRGLEAHRIKISNARVVLDLPRAARRFRELGIDLIHCHGYKPSVFAFVIGLLARIRVIATCHLWFVGTNAPLKMRVLIAVEKILYRHFPAVVAVSEHIGETLLSAGVNPKRLRLICNGIVLADYESSAPRPTGCSLGIERIEEGDVCVLNVGRLTEQKAQRDLVSAAALARSAMRNLKILIVGEGELRAALAQQIAAASLDEGVILLGFRSDIAALLRRADIFALASLDEGMPVSLLEAVAARVPVIVTGVGDVPKLIVDGKTGLIVNRRDPAGLAAAIVTLASDPAKGSALAERAWQALETSYSSARMYDSYSRVYRDILSGLEMAR
jgi:glycosyltransferase involved in cell wall biosynthesis